MRRKRRRCSDCPKVLCEGSEMLDHSRSLQVNLLSDPTAFESCSIASSCDSASALIQARAITAHAALSPSLHLLVHHSTSTLSNMALVSSQESTRISSHMNNDHSSSIAHYLEHYGKVSTQSASLNPKITNFSTPSMTLEYGPEGKRKEYVHKFEPPMYAGQARSRLEAMHREAREGLGLVSLERCSRGIGICMADRLGR